MSARTSLWPALSWPLLFTLGAVTASYVFDAGHGFLKDDFGWIRDSTAAASEATDAFTSSQAGFYRPLVALSFALSWRLFGLEPLGYGLTNLLLALACVALVYALARAVGVGPTGAAVAAAVWGLNPHGVGGAVMWISGRTSLLATLFSVGAAILVLAGRSGLAAACCFAALCSKEETALLPFVLARWSFLFGPDGPSRERLHRAGLVLLVLGAALAAYAVARWHSGAFGPWSAPPSYRFTVSPAAVLRNLAEYADRVGTLAALALVGAVLLLGRARLSARHSKPLLGGRRIIKKGCAPTILLPVRSSLYVLLPGVGVAIAVAAVIDALWDAADARSRGRAALVGVFAAVALVPLLHSRSMRIRHEAELSSGVLRRLESVREQLAAGRVLVLHDDPVDRVNLAAAFGTYLETAVRLQLRLPQARVWLEPPSPLWEQAGVSRPARGPSVACRLVRRRIDDCRPGEW